MVPAYSPEARGQSERMFGTHQDRLVKELAPAGITDMAAANRYIQEAYMPALNSEFARPAREDGSAFVAMRGPQALDDILCEVHERVVGRDNCVRFERLALRIEADGERPHYVKATVKVRRHMDGSLSVWHGPRLLQRYEGDGTPRPKPLAEAAWWTAPRNPDRETGQIMCYQNRTVLFATDTHPAHLSGFRNIWDFRDGT